MLKTLRKSLRWIRREDGTVTVEFVILFPVMLLVTGVAMDVGFMYYKMSQIHEAVQSVTRWRSIGAIATNDQAKQDLSDLIAQGFSDEVPVSQIDMTLKGSLVSTAVHVPMHDLQLVGFFAGLIGDPMIYIGDQQFLESFAIASYDPNGGWTPEDMTMVNGIMVTTSPIDTSTTTTTAVSSTITY